MDRRVFIKRAALGVVLASAGSPLALRAAAEELKQKVGTKPVLRKSVNTEGLKATQGLQRAPQGAAGMVTIRPRSGQPFEVSIQQKAAFDSLPRNLQAKLRTPGPNEAGKLMSAAQLRELGDAYRVIAKLDPGATAETVMCPW